MLSFRRAAGVRSDGTVKDRRLRWVEGVLVGFMMTVLFLTCSFIKSGLMSIELIMSSLARQP